MEAPPQPVRLITVAAGLFGCIVLAAGGMFLYMHLSWPFDLPCQMEREQTQTAPDGTLDAVAYSPQCGVLGPAVESRGLAIEMAGVALSPETSRVVVEPTTDYFQFSWLDSRTLEIAHHSQSIRVPESVNGIRLVIRQE